MTALRWGDYLRYGAVIQGTKIIPMKTPLTLELQRSYMPSEGEPRPFTVQTFLDDQAALGRRVALIVDLTNHQTLYAEDIPPGLDYKHFTFVAKKLPDPPTCRKVRPQPYRYICPRRRRALVIMFYTAPMTHTH
jgi:hypothetical protein